MLLDEQIALAAVGAERLRNDVRGALRRFLTMLARGDGGFAGAVSAGSDIYYTPFAAMALDSLGAAPSPTDLAGFADSKTEFEPLDLAHLASLARLEALIVRFGGRRARRRRCGELVSAILAYRSGDGGFSHLSKSAASSTPYGVFLAANAFAELESAELAHAIPADPVLERRMPDGSFSNIAGGAGGLNPTAAAVAYLAEFHRVADFNFEGAIAYMRSLRFSNGGFKANESAPLPDVLSTASAAFALQALDVEMDAEERASHGRFIQDHWRDISDDAGGFAGSIISETPDAEYTFHALMALGAVSN